MDNNEDKEIVESLIDDLHTVNLLICILNQLPKGCILTLTDYIYSAFADGWLLKLKDYMSIDGVYYLFELSQDCIHYIEKELLSSPEFIHYFCHYGIRRGNQRLLRVYDETIFVIDPSLNIPASLINSCEEHEIYVYREVITKDYFES